MKKFLKCSMALMFFMLAAAIAFAQNPEAFIREVSGTVELKFSGSENWVTAKNGDRITESTIISTGFRSMAVLSVGSSTITVRPLTRLSLEALIQQNDTETINVGLRTGRMQVDVKAPSGSRADFTVSTPAATASVRGTSFTIDPLNIRVTEGSVRYVPITGQAAARPVMVAAGQQSWVDSDTGQTVTPQAAAETTRSLPALAGQDKVSNKQTGSRLKVPQGTTVVEITITAGN